MQTRGIDWQQRRNLKKFIRKEDLEWNYNLYMNDIEINKLSFFKGPDYQDYFEYLDSVNGFYLYRWGDHALRTLAVGMFLEPEDVMQMKIPYGHQGYCRCLSGRKCVAESKYYEGALSLNLTTAGGAEGSIVYPPTFYRPDWRVCAEPLPVPIRKKQRKKKKSKSESSDDESSSESASSKEGEEEGEEDDEDDEEESRIDEDTGWDLEGGANWDIPDFLKNKNNTNNTNGTVNGSKSKN